MAGAKTAESGRHGSWTDRRDGELVRPSSGRLVLTAPFDSARAPALGPRRARVAVSLRSWVPARLPRPRATARITHPASRAPIGSQR